MPPPAELELFVACAPGLEPVLAAELAELVSDDAASVRSVAGGCTLRGNATRAQRVNHWSGVGTHVLVRLATFQTRHLNELRQRAERIDWRRWLAPGSPFTVDATSRKSKLYHTGAIAERVGDAVRSALGSTPAESSDGEDDELLTVRVRVLHDRVTISLDVSGAPLHRRGWRLATAKAPLREDLAHALVRASGWDRASPCVDPFAGSGTIAVEAAGLGLGLAPGRGRSFALARTPLAAAVDDAAVAAPPRAPAARSAEPFVFASDRDDGAVAAARDNAERAGVAEHVAFAVAPLAGAAFVGDGDAAATPPGHGAVVTNPPWGRRTTKGPDRLAPLYQSFGHRVAQLPAAWRVAVLAADRRLALRSGLALGTAFLTTSGGVSVRALVGSAGTDAAETTAMRDD